MADGQVLTVQKKWQSEFTLVLRRSRAAACELSPVHFQAEPNPNNFQRRKAASKGEENGRKRRKSAQNRGFPGDFCAFLRPAKLAWFAK
jgi:hypothetical protein